MVTYQSRNGNTDTFLMLLVLTGILLGLFLLYSANNFSLSLPIKQLIKGSVCAVFIIIIARSDERHIRDASLPLYILSLLLLLLVLYLGYATKGAQRWLDFYLFRFEPSELVKTTVPLLLANHIHKNGIPIKSASLAQAIVIILLPFYLVLKQPDLGTAMIICLIGSITLFIAGLSRKFIIISLVSVFAAAPLLWTQLHSYQQQRIITLFSGQDDLQHHGYHIHQSKIAIGSGGLWGKGYGRGSQVQLGYIPEHKTDFIFTVLSEEFGFLGNLLWILLVLGIGLRSVFLGYKQSLIFNKVVCIALGCSFMLNAWINMSMVSGILPVVGIPLPLLSYGGTSFVATLVNFALILKLGHTDPRRQHLW